jgi:HMG-box domain
VKKKMCELEKERGPHKVPNLGYFPQAVTLLWEALPETEKEKYQKLAEEWNKKGNPEAVHRQ